MSYEWKDYEVDYLKEDIKTLERKMEELQRIVEILCPHSELDSLKYCTLCKKKIWPR